MNRIKKLLPAVCFFGSFSFAHGQTTYFPPTGSATWDTVSLDSLGWCRDKVDSLLQYVGSRNTRAFMVLVDGKIAVEKYYGSFTQDSVWYWASAGKTITATAVGIAQQEGYLSISDTTSKYIGQGWAVCTPAQEAKITIRNQLSMISGLNDSVPDHYCTLDTCLQYKADAGTRWAYHNGPYTLLDSVIESATGTSLNLYVYNKIAKPIGMTGLFVPQGFNNVYFSTARSMARFGLMILNNGVWNGFTIVKDTAYFRQMVNTSQTLNQSYGYLWWLNGKASYMVPKLQYVFSGPLNPSAPADMFAGLGKNGQLLNVVPSMKLVMVRMGDVPSAGEVPFTLNDTIWQYLSKVPCTTASVKTIETDHTLQIYPNPASSSLFVAVPAGCSRFSIYNMTGTILYSSASITERASISCDQWPDGIYFIEAFSGNGSSMRKKFAVMH